MLLTRKNNNRPVPSLAGFTLIEMLLVIAVVSVISLAIYATLNNGLKLWQKANRQLPEEDLNIFLDKFTVDLRNSFKFTGIDFSGAPFRMEFPTLVSSQALRSRSVGRVGYGYEPGSGVLIRAQQDFSQAYTAESRPLPVLSNIKSLKFQYYVYDKEKKEYLWLEEWAKEGLPAAVRIELEMGYDSQDNKFIKTVSIPCSG
jgi:prepilin-type N-terminal cleavage/methylation domain-containing protein